MNEIVRTFRVKLGVAGCSTDFGLGEGVVSEQDLNVVCHPEDKTAVIREMKNHVRRMSGDALNFSAEEVSRSAGDYPLKIVPRGTIKVGDFLER